MTAYMVVQGTVADEEQFAKYREAVLPLITRFGGKHLRAGPTELLEGKGDAQQIVTLFAFPSIEAIRSFWHSPDYVPVKEIRRGAAVLNVWAFPGA